MITPTVLASPTILSSPVPQLTPLTFDPFPEPQGEINQSYSFEYRCNTYSITLPLYQSTYEYFLAADKNYYYRGTLPDGWQQQFYLNFLTSQDDLEMVNDLIDGVSVAIDQSGDDLVMALTSLVQHLTYDCDKLFSYERLDGEGYQTNFPYETLFTKSGVCGDTSILLGKILRELGYGAALLIYEDNNHMALGIQCPLEAATYVEGMAGYCYIETTGPTRIGVKPTELGGNEFVEEPWIIPINGGKSFERMISLIEEMEEDALLYGDMIIHLDSCQEIELYKEIQERNDVITAHDGHLANLGITMDQAESEFQMEKEVFNSMGCEGTLPQDLYELCVAQQAVVEGVYATYEEARNQYNQVVMLRNADVERLNQAVKAFNSLMDARDQSCAVVWSERIETPEEGE